MFNDWITRTLEFPTHIIARILKFGELVLNYEHEEKHSVNDIFVYWSTGRQVDRQKVDRSTGRQVDR